jgi:hypothetical protein
VYNYENGSVFRTKLFFWALGYDGRKESRPKLIVTGKRLDGDAPDVAEPNATNAFMLGTSGPAAILTMIDIPIAGCWEITAHYRGHALTFVVSVEP